MKFKQQLEKFTGVELTDRRLRASIEIYNKNRNLLRKVYELRGERKLSGREAAEIVSSSAMMLKEDHNRLVAEIIGQAQQREPRNWRARLHVSGTILSPDYVLYDLVEELGATVISDDLCTGSRYFQGEVDTTLPPMEALVDYILYRRQHCPYVIEPESWGSNIQYINDMMQNCGAQGVLFLTQKWCDAMSFQRRYREIEFDKQGVPWINFEIDRAIVAEQLRTRLEALLEVMEGRSRYE